MAETQSQDVQFEIRKIYLKDLSYESPLSPGIFARQDAKPEIDIQLQVSDQALSADNGIYEVVLTITATAKTDAETFFLIEVQQGGIFEIRGLPEGELKKALHIACPNVILPFAREAVSDMAIRGGFPQLLINPVNFEALYHQKEQQASAAEQPTH